MDSVRERRAPPIPETPVQMLTSDAHASRRSDARRVQLRAMSYDEGEAALAPDGPQAVGPDAPQADSADLDESGAGDVNASTTDPRLTYTQKAKDEQKGVDATKLPYNDAKTPEAGWDHAAILSKLTQVDESNDTVTDEVRCAANSALAIAILGGPNGVTQFSQRLDVPAMAIMLRRGKHKDIPEERRARVEAQFYAQGLAEFRIRMGAGTFADLSIIANACKIIMAAKPDGETTGYEAAAMAGLAGDTQTKGTPIDDPAHLKVFTDQIAPGEAYVLHVDTDVYEGGMRSSKQDNHFIIVGKDPKADAGGVFRIFQYDPYPREGPQLMRSADPGFWTLFTNKDGLPKAVFITSKTTAGKYSSEVFPPGWDQK